MHILALDDDPVRHRHFRRGLIGVSLTQCTRADEAIGLLDSIRPRPAVVFLDHDLDQHGDLTAGNGMQVVDWILTNPSAWRRTRFMVHSINPVRGPVMADRLRMAGLNALYVPHAWQRDAVLNLALAHARAAA